MFVFVNCLFYINNIYTYIDLFYILFSLFFLLNLISPIAEMRSFIFIVNSLFDTLLQFPLFVFVICLFYINNIYIYIDLFIYFIFFVFFC